MKMNKNSLVVGVIILTALAYSPSAKAANVSAWLPSWDVAEAMETFEANKASIDVISPFWYHVNADGTLSPTKNSEDQEVIDFAQAHNIPVIPTISNSFDGQKITGFLNDPIQREAHIKNIVDKVKEFKYDGIDIDYEGVMKDDMEVFSAFIKELDEALETDGKKLTIAVMPKSYPMLPIFGERGQDWKELAKYVDEFRIMTYDYGWSGSKPRPIAPYYWVEEVVKYGVDHVPAEKIRLGIPFYSYAWSDNGLEGGKSFLSYSYETILGILETYGVDLQYDPRERTNRLFYLSNNDDRVPKAPYEIWMENSVSLESKLDLVKKYNLGGIAIWRLGKEDAKNWSLIQAKLKGADFDTELYFTDTTEKTPYFEAIQRLAFLGLVKGQGDSGRFDPSGLVNRAEILKMALNSFAVDTSAQLFPAEATGQFLAQASSSRFPDVSFGAWYYPYVQTAVEEGVIQGYPDGTFQPGNNIIRVEALKLALESAGIDLSNYATSPWYLPYQSWAIENGLYTKDQFKPGEAITRAEAAYIMVKVIEAVEKEPQYSTYSKINN